MKQGRVILVLALLGAAVPANGQTNGSAAAGPTCSGTYADSLISLSAAARTAERGTSYTFCIRSTAVYQCPYYDREGLIRKRRETAVSHGTGFAFRGADGATWLLTNQHVAESPPVTDDEQAPEGVPPGCKRVEESLAIVDDESDEYSQDDVALQRVLADREMDIAILRAPRKLPVMPFRLGQSAALAVGNVVHARGFPLGSLETANDGKVVNARERDLENGWLHDDFVVDASLSSGNSGSPVFAVSCATGEFELVGIFHASYWAGNALNAVIGIDQIREMLVTMKPRRRQAETDAPGAGDRARLLAALKAPMVLPVVPFGSWYVRLRAGTDGVLLFDLFDDSFLLTDSPVVAIEDLPGPGFGRLGRTWIRGNDGMAERTFASLDKVDQALLERTLDTVRRQAIRVFEYRAVSAAARRSRSAYDRLGAIRRSLDRADRNMVELTRGLGDAAARLAPRPKDR